MYLVKINYIVFKVYKIHLGSVLRPVRAKPGVASV